MFSPDPNENGPHRYNIRLTEQELKFINDLIANVEKATIFSKKQSIDSKKPRLTVLVTEGRKCFLIGDGERKDEEGKYVLRKNAYLGEGAFGRAKAAAQLIGEKGKANIDNKLFAVKIIHRNKERGKKEADFFSKANGYAEYVDGGDFKKGYIVEDFIPGVEFSDLLHTVRNTSECINIISAGLTEIARLHNLNICHGDGGTNNLKYDQKSNTVRFIDFGLSYEPNEHNHFDEEKSIGSLVLIFRWYVENNKKIIMADFSFEYLKGSMARLTALITSFFDSETGKLSTLDKESLDKVQEAVKKEVASMLNINIDDATLKTIPNTKLEEILLKCIKLNDITTFKKVLPFCDKEAALFKVLESNKKDFIKTVLDYDDLNPNKKRNHKSQTPLFIASQLGNAPAVKRLLELGADIDGYSNWGKKSSNPLFIACNSGHLEVVQVLLKHKADINNHDRDHYSPLHHAILAGDPLSNNHASISIINELIKNGADVDYQVNDKSKTPLHLAVELGFLDTARVLLASGAKLTDAIIEANNSPEFVNLFDSVKTIQQASEFLNNNNRTQSLTIFSPPDINSYYKQAMHKDCDYFYKYYVPATIEQLARKDPDALRKFIALDAVQQTPNLKQLLENNKIFISANMRNI